MAEVDNFLAHYGVTGMKWGVRKGGVKSRIQGAASDSVERRLVRDRAIATGTATTRDYRRNIAKGGTFGVVTGTRQKSAAKRTKKLEALKDRVDNGKTSTWDKVGIAMNTHPGDLVVSRRDKRALPDSPAAKVNTGKQKALKIMAGAAGAVAISVASNKQNQAMAADIVRMGMDAAKRAKTNRTNIRNDYSDSHGLPTGPTIRLHQNPTTGNWV
ncbi:hypothetical protein PBI_SPORTO_11 [Arthrobacter phage Sporto]|nr:hypothetical protein PBI_SPORTO_11 [Arthrobacter phage Sporto]